MNDQTNESGAKKLSGNDDEDINSTSFPEVDPGPLNTTPDAPGPDAPEVYTGSSTTGEEPAQDIDEDEVGSEGAKPA